MTHDPGALAALRTQIARLEGVGRDHDALRPVIPFGLAAIDDAVPGGGLALGALHELAGTGLDTEYGTAPALLAAGFAGRSGRFRVLDRRAISSVLAGPGCRRASP